MSLIVNDDPVFEALRRLGLNTAAFGRPLTITRVGVGSVLHSGVLSEVASTFDALGFDHVAILDVLGRDSRETADLANAGEIVQGRWAACNTELFAIPVNGAKLETTHDQTVRGDSSRAHTVVLPIPTTSTAGMVLIDNFAGRENGPKVLGRDHAIADKLLGDDKSFSKLDPDNRSKLNKGCLDYLVLFILDCFLETLPAPEELSKRGSEDQDVDGR